MIKHVIFDLDGTLLDTLDDLAAAVNYALIHHGYPPRTTAEVCRFIGHGVRVLMTRALPGGERNPQFAAVLDTFCRYYAAHNRVKTAPYAGIALLLARLREGGLRAAVVSNKFDAAVKDLCALYFGDRIEPSLAIGERPDIPKKPAPDMLLLAMRALQATPADTVYVGDSEVDIETAARAGVPCISVLWGFRGRDALLAAGATQLVADPAELEKILFSS